MRTLENKFEIFVGFIALCIAGMFAAKLLLTTNISNKSSGSLVITGDFSNAEGIEIGSDVKIAGVKIGSVFDKKITDNYYARVYLSIESDVKIPSDSSLSILSSGLLGGKYIEVKPGYESVYIQNSGHIISTQSSMNLEELIGKFAFSK